MQSGEKKGMLPTWSGYDPNNLTQTVIHEVGHTVGSKPDFMRATDVVDGEEIPVPLEKQWGRIAMKTTPGSKNPAFMENMNHNTWWDDKQGNLRPGYQEQFADTFADAVNYLRKNWDPKSVGGDQAELREMEKSRPGITYVLKYLTSQTPYHQHPLGRALGRSK